ncbi:MAG: hypothetical protein SV375_24110, partial [Thermodesulfobacteriota bacterium]|nr:hypothetical protein [Thermodesulfobacteriota bacterium]
MIRNCLYAVIICLMISLSWTRHVVGYPEAFGLNKQGNVHGPFIINEMKVVRKYFYSNIKELDHPILIAKAGGKKEDSQDDKGLKKDDWGEKETEKDLWDDKGTQ